MEVKIESSWKKVLEQEFSKPYFIELTKTVKEEYQNHKIFPEPQNIFRSLDLVPFNQVKVIILGQDPYHTPGVADGLAFSSLTGNKVPLSLQNIYKEIIEEYKLDPYPDYTNPDLTRWANQGILLLNNTLTVRSGEPNSHSDLGWSHFTNFIVSELAQKRQNLVFILWGNFAKQKKSLITHRNTYGLWDEKESTNTNNHLILESPHPSPFSAYNGFFGNNHFRLANQFLEGNGIEIIDW